MAEKGIDISRNKSKSLEDIPLSELDYVITLCEDAAETCPFIPGVDTLHWGLPDPAKVEGNKDEILSEFRKVRDTVEVKVRQLIDDIC